MSRGANSGRSPFERLRQHYDDDLVCPKCRHEDEGGEWVATTTGDEVHYRHLCPSCGYVRRRTLRRDSNSE